jgi:hypothetical protein
MASNTAPTTYILLKGFSEKVVHDLVDEIAEQAEEQNQNQNYVSKYGKMEISTIEPELVRVKLSDLEKARKKEAYRSEYRKRPEVVAKREARNESEELRKARKEYAQQPEVKARKMELAKARRQMLKTFKEQHPREYSNIKKTLYKPIERKRPRKSEAKSSEPPAKKIKTE